MARYRPLPESAEPVARPDSCPFCQSKAVGTLAKVITTSTANGPAQGCSVVLASVRVGDIEMRHVRGTVLEGGDRTLPIVLIGMSFLQHVEMRRSGTVMTLTRPSLQ